MTLPITAAPGWSPGHAYLPGSFTSAILSNSTFYELAVLLLDLADVDGLHDVARLRIDHDRAARARRSSCP